MGEDTNTYLINTHLLLPHAEFQSSIPSVRYGYGFDNGMNHRTIYTTKVFIGSMPAGWKNHITLWKVDGHGLDSVHLKLQYQHEKGWVVTSISEDGWYHSALTCDLVM